jgi:ribosome maturation factor RimP
MSALKHKIEQLILPKLDEMHCYLVEVRVLNNGGKIEVYIDHLEHPVTIGECEIVSRYLAFNLDNDPTVANDYLLEVSSPGMENPFKVPQQYDKNKGRWVEVLLFDGMKKEGILTHADDNSISIDIHHPPKKKGMKPEIAKETIQFINIKTVKKKVTFN